MSAQEPIPRKLIKKTAKGLDRAKTRSAFLASAMLQKSLAEWDIGGLAYSMGTGLSARYLSTDSELKSFLFGASQMHRATTSGLLTGRIIEDRKVYNLRPLRSWITGTLRKVGAGPSHLLGYSEGVREGRGPYFWGSWGIGTSGGHLIARRRYGVRSGTARRSYSTGTGYGKGYKRVYRSSTGIRRIYKRSTRGYSYWLARSYGKKPYARTTRVGGGGRRGFIYTDYYDPLRQTVGYDEYPEFTPGRLYLTRDRQMRIFGGDYTGETPFAQQYLADIPEYIQQMPAGLQSLLGIYREPSAYTPEWAQQAREYQYFGFIMPSLAPSYTLSMFNAAYRAGYIPTGMMPQPEAGYGLYTYLGRADEAQQRAEDYRQYALGTAREYQRDYFMAQQNLWQAREKYWEFQQEWAPAALAWGATRLSSYLMSGDWWYARAFGWPVYGAAQRMGVGAQMAPFIQQAKGYDPIFTKYALENYAMFSPGQYRTFEEQMFAGAIEWTAIQTAMWGARAVAAGETRGFGGTLKQTMGVGLLQFGMGLTADILSTMAVRAMWGEELVPPEQRMNVIGQLGIGIGTMGVGAYLWSKLGIRGAGGIGGGINVTYQPEFGGFRMFRGQPTDIPIVDRTIIRFMQERPTELGIRLGPNQYEQPFRNIWGEVTGWSIKERLPRWRVGAFEGGPGGEFISDVGKPYIPRFPEVEIGAGQRPVFRDWAWWVSTDEFTWDLALQARYAATAQPTTAMRLTYGQELNRALETTLDETKLLRWKYNPITDTIVPEIRPGFGPEADINKRFLRIEQERVPTRGVSWEVEGRTPAYYGREVPEEIRLGGQDISAGMRGARFFGGLITNLAWYALQTTLIEPAINKWIDQKTDMIYSDKLQVKGVASVALTLAGFPAWFAGEELGPAALRLAQKALPSAAARLGFLGPAGTAIAKLGGPLFLMYLTYEAARMIEATDPLAVKWREARQAAAPWAPISYAERFQAGRDIITRQRDYPLLTAYAEGYGDQPDWYMQYYGDVQAERWMGRVYDALGQGRMATAERWTALAYPLVERLPASTDLLREVLITQTMRPSRESGKDVWTYTRRGYEKISLEEYAKGTMDRFLRGGATPESLRLEVLNEKTLESWRELGVVGGPTLTMADYAAASRLNALAYTATGINYMQTLDPTWNPYDVDQTRWYEGNIFGYYRLGERIDLAGGKIDITKLNLLSTAPDVKVFWPGLKQPYYTSDMSIFFKELRTRMDLPEGWGIYTWGQYREQIDLSYKRGEISREEYQAAMMETQRDELFARARIYSWETGEYPTGPLETWAAQLEGFTSKYFMTYELYQPGYYPRTITAPIGAVGKLPTAYYGKFEKYEAGAIGGGVNWYQMRASVQADLAAGNISQEKYNYTMAYINKQESYDVYKGFYETLAKYKMVEDPFKIQPLEWWKQAAYQIVQQPITAGIPPTSFSDVMEAAYAGATASELYQDIKNAYAAYGITPSGWDILKTLETLPNASIIIDPVTGLTTSASVGVGPGLTAAQAAGAQHAGIVSQDQRLGTWANKLGVSTFQMWLFNQPSGMANVSGGLSYSLLTRGQMTTAEWEQRIQRTAASFAFASNVAGGQANLEAAKGFYTWAAQTGQYNPNIYTMIAWVYKQGYELGGATSGEMWANFTKAQEGALPWTKLQGDFASGPTLSQIAGYKIFQQQFRNLGLLPFQWEEPAIGGRPTEQSLNPIYGTGDPSGRKGAGMAWLVLPDPNDRRYDMLLQEFYRQLEVYQKEGYDIYRLSGGAGRTFYARKPGSDIPLEDYSYPVSYGQVYNWAKYGVGGTTGGSAIAPSTASSRHWAGGEEIIMEDWMRFGYPSEAQFKASRPNYAQEIAVPTTPIDPFMAAYLYGKDVTMPKNLTGQEIREWTKANPYAGLGAHANIGAAYSYNYSMTAAPRTDQYMDKTQWIDYWVSQHPGLAESEAEKIYYARGGSGYTGGYNTRRPRSYSTMSWYQYQLLYNVAGEATSTMPWYVNAPEGWVGPRIAAQTGYEGIVQGGRSGNQQSTPQSNPISTFEGTVKNGPTTFTVAEQGSEYVSIIPTLHMISPLHTYKPHETPASDEKSQPETARREERRREFLSGIRPKGEKAAEDLPYLWPWILAAFKTVAAPIVSQQMVTVLQERGI